MSQSDGRHLQSKNLPHLKILIRLGEEKTPGFLNFDDLYTNHQREDVEKLHRVENNAAPEDPINIQVSLTVLFNISKYFSSGISSLLEQRVSLRVQHSAIKIFFIMVILSAKDAAILITTAFASLSHFIIALVWSWLT